MPFHDWELPVAELLLKRGADLSVRVKLPGYYERPEEVVGCTPLGYALRFLGQEGKTVTLSRFQNDHDSVAPNNSFRVLSGPSPFINASPIRNPL
jgi:hypothetical protein